MGLWNNLEVSFTLGESLVKPGHTAATSIILTEKGFGDANNIIANIGKTGTIQTGFVEVFFPDYLTGRVQAGGKKYNFGVNAIIDPWLKAYYMECFSPEVQDVSFEISGAKAINICWINPNEEQKETYAKSIKDEDIYRWNRYLEQIESKKQIQSMPARDPYEEIPYVGLLEMTSINVDEDIAPFTWGGKTIVGKSAADEITRIKAKTLPQKDSTLERKPLPQDSKVLADNARKAMLEGRLSEAEEYFKEALRIGGFNEAVVCDYISLSMRQEGKIEVAVQLIQKYSHQISEDKLLNLKIQVFDKKKDYKSLCPLYEEAFRKGSTISKKSHSLIRLIDAHVKLGNYNDALEACKRWEAFYNQNKYGADSDKLKRATTLVNRQKAVCFYHLGKVEEARLLATDLVRANPADTAANSILDGTLGKDNIPLAIDSSEEDIFEIGEQEETIEEVESMMSRFVRLLIQQTDIGVNLKSPNIKDGQYVGSTKEGLEDVKKLANRSRLSLKMRSDTLLAACKLLEQLETRGDDIATNEYYKYRLAGRAMASWGDFMVSQLTQLDTSRMAYLYALKVLVPTKKGAEQDWINSYNRYIKSYFMARIGSNSLEEYISKQTNSKAKDGANTDVLVGNRIQDVLLSEFLVGMLMLIKAIGAQKERKRTFVDDLYYKNSELKDSICNQLGVFLERSIPTTISNDQFFAVMTEAMEVLGQKMMLMHNLMLEVSSILLSMPLNNEVVAGLDIDKWRYYLTATDSARLSRINYVIKRSQDYFASRDFENRTDCLRAILIEVNELLQSITREPTDVSYDIFLPALEQMAFKITDKQTELYQDFLPKLSWRETIQPFRTPDGQIQIQLTVENELNYQSADSLTIVSVQSPDVAWFTSEGIQSLRGGDEVEIGLLVALKDNDVQGGSFSATIGYSYKCSDSPQNVITKIQEEEFTFIIHNENFEPLINPFSAYEGKVMDDDSMFVGRSTQIQQILDMICSDKNGKMNYGRAIAMYGQTRTGKSSLLYHLKKKLEERYQDKILIWDIGNIGELPESDEYMANFLYTLLDIGKEALYDNSSLADIIDSENLIPPLKDIRNDPTFAISIFNAYMKKLNSILIKQQKIIVLIIDEFTYLHGFIKEGKITSDFMRFWKALIQNYCVFAIVAGQDDMPEFMREYQNEFACMELLKLTYLEERDAKKLIQEPLESINKREELFKNDGSVHKLYNLTAGSAYLTIILCSKLVSFLNEKGAYMVTKGIVNEFLRTKAFGPNGFLTEVHFEAQLQERGHRELDNINKEILLSVARLSQTTGYADINAVECEGLCKEEIRTYADRLVDRNVLVKEGRDFYWIQVKLLERWLINAMGA